ncbi:365_t:CDS:1, partial [Racocetra fulgida]
MLENLNNESSQHEQKVIVDLLVTKRREHPPTKRLKGSSKNLNYRGLVCNYTIDPQDSNLRKYLSQILIQ